MLAVLWLTTCLSNCQCSEGVQGVQVLHWRCCFKIIEGNLA